MIVRRTSFRGIRGIANDFVHLIAKTVTNHESREENERLLSGNPFFGREARQEVIMFDDD